MDRAPGYQLSSNSEAQLNAPKKIQILNRLYPSTHSRTPCFLVKQSFKIQAVKDYDYIPPSLQFSSPFLKPLLYILQCIRCEKQKQTGGVQIIHKSCLKSKLIYLSTLAVGHRDTNHAFFLFGLLLRRNAATYLSWARFKYWLRSQQVKSPDLTSIQEPGKHA